MAATLSNQSHRYAGRGLLALVGAALLLGTVLSSMVARANQATSSPLANVLSKLQPQVVKIYGVGGPRGMEGYQSGLLISDQGHVLTAWSYVLDTDLPTVVLHDGRKFGAELIGADPRLEIAVLKIDAKDLPHFDLTRAVDVLPGTRVLALSNLFGVATGNEPLSVQHGVISVKTPLKARRGTFETPYDGPVYVMDAMTNNPGAAGGALVTRRGLIVGVLGKELRNASNHTWLNYAVPIEIIRPSVEQILTGKYVAAPEKQERKPTRPLALDDLGIVMVPEVLSRTPPYIDMVRTDSPADEAGLIPDDLVVLINDRLIQSCRMLYEELEHVDREDTIRLSVMRDGQLMEFTLAAPKP